MMMFRLMATLSVVILESIAVADLLQKVFRPCTAALHR